MFGTNKVNIHSSLNEKGFCKSAHLLSCVEIRGVHAEGEDFHLALCANLTAGLFLQSKLFPTKLMQRLQLLPVLQLAAGHVCCGCAPVRVAA